MSIEKLLLSYQVKGVNLSVNDDKLKVSAPQNTLTDEDKRVLKENKEKILEYLSMHPESKIVADPENRYEEFPLTDIQSSYLIGQDTMYKYGGTNCKICSEFEFDELDRDKVQSAWHELIKHNDMMHAVIEESGVQRVLKEYELPQIPFNDISNLDEKAVGEYIENKRKELILKQYKPGTWPQFALEMTKLKDRYILHLSLDMLIADFVSVNLILDEFEQFYYDKKEKSLTDLSFRDIVIYRENKKNSAEGRKKYKEDKEYWMNKIETMPQAPDFPVDEKNDNSDVLFKQHLFFVDRDAYTKLKKTAKEEKLTPTSLLLTAYAETLRAMSKNRSFCIDVTMSDRPNLHPDIKKVIGDFTIASILAIEDKQYPTYLDEAKDILGRLWEDLGHNSFSSTEVLREMSKKNKGDIAVPAVFTSTLGAMDGVNERKGRPLYTISQTPQVLIDCQILETDGQLRVNWDVRQGVFPDGFIDSSFELFKENVFRLIDSEGLKSTVTSRLPESVKKVREEANDTDKKIEASYLYEGFLRSLNNTPKAPALYSKGVSYTYEELSDYVVTIRNELKAAGFKEGEKVAVSLSKGVWQISAVLAILTCGGTYLPLDVHQPKERAEKILATSGTNLVILENPEYITAKNVTKIDVQKLRPVEIHEKIKPFEPGLSYPAYVIFTSGSTGTPKGVVISHEAASNTILDINERYNVTSKDKLLNLANLGFDLSVYDIFGAFYAGAELVQATEELAKDPSHWLELLKEKKITVWNSVPAQMKMLTMLMDGQKEEAIESLKLILLSGDWIPTDLPKELGRFFPKSSPISLGGATEAAIWSIYYPIDTEAVYERSIPYGKPLANQRFYILDENLNEVTDWITGSIYIAGKGLALEYLNDRELTDKKFIFNKKLGERLYRTGDIGRYMSDGNIEFLGREDFQVKIRGHRVELGEIEAAVNEVIDLKDIKVIAVKHNNAVNICMFGVPEDKDKLPDKDSLDEMLSKKLPKYMIPSFCKYIDAIPLTKNGKVDSKALNNEAVQLIEANKGSGDTDTDTLSEKEKNIYGVWCEIFNTEKIDIDEDFFDCGGDSILIVKLISELEARFNYKLTLPEVYEGPTVRMMAQNV